MIKYFGKAFKVTNENIILTTPLVLFLFLLSLYLGVAQKAPVNNASVILLSFTILFMLSAFFAGWFFMVKRAIDLEKLEFVADEDKAKASFALLKEIPIGIGEYFIPFIGALILYSVIFLVLLFAAFKFGMHFIGNIGLSLDQLKLAFNSPEAMKHLVSTLSTAQLTKLNSWNFLFLSIVSFFSFITMFWSVQIVSGTKNPILGFVKSINFLFKNFLGSVVLFVYISIINFVVSLINAFSTINPIVYFISMIIYFYFLVYIVVLIFLYYDRQSNKTLGEKIQSNSDSGSDSIGQEQSGDSDSEEN